MDHLTKLDIAFRVFLVAIALFIPGTLFYKFYGAYIALWIVLLVGGAVLSLLLWGVGALWRRHKIARNPLDPSLRSLVASDLSWENCATSPEFCASALPEFRFLIDEESFEPAQVDRNFSVLLFRRGGVAVNVGEGAGPSGPQAIIEVTLFRSPQSFRPVAGIGFGGETDGLGDGYRGAAFFLRSNLDRIIADLREEAGTNLNRPWPTPE